MIEAHEYQKSHYDLIVMMQETHGVVEPIPPELLPDIGYLITEGAIPVAIGFLKTNLNKLVIYNNDLDPELIRSGLKLLVSKLNQVHSVYFN